eukprot:TRINITY_DN1001_c0_g1_i2.p1 TRINITY_DN1001_c0_g1~~TRINITY_DN1001_c0_g1_i2.p1  ORF type:complete len:163 (-),score=20.11 TRINITY_DN1001_c0_g1_i2:231-719(-)
MCFVPLHCCPMALCPRINTDVLILSSTPPQLDSSSIRLIRSSPHASARNTMTHFASQSLSRKLHDRYKRTFRNRIDVGTRVEAIKHNNALRKHFPCRVINVRELPISDEVGVYAEKNIAAKLIATGGGVFAVKKYTYDLRYDDGSIDENVKPELIRAVVSNV